VTQEAIESGNMIETSKIIGGVTLKRFKVLKFTSTTPPFQAEVELLNEDLSIEKENKMHNDGLIKKLQEYSMKYIGLISETEARARTRADFIKSESNLLRLHYTIANYLKISDEEKYHLLEINDPEERIKKLVQILEEQIKLGEVKGEIMQKTKQNMQQEMRREFLKKHLKEINKELYGSEKDEMAVLEQKINEAGMPEEVLEKVKQEFNRLRQMNSRDPDYNVQKKYLDIVVDLPWNKSSQEINDITHAEKILNRDHAGLEKIKKRILEFLAVKILKKNSKGSILCFQGPPGVGKTSLGKSIAEALGRKFHRVSLGGVRDEAEIRGHRRTYVGAMPGVFIEALLRCKTNNPVILLDEIDKVGRDGLRGDPSSALLEVLDPSQNHTFKDHYLGLPFDLSNVLFIATANNLETIQGPLLDRMEVISLPGYTLYEKTEIAKNYLVPKQIQENGLEKSHVEFPDSALQYLINYYTREAGVRNLERSIGSICRKVAFDYLKTQSIGDEIDNKKENKPKKPFKTVKVTEKFIEEVLGPKMYDDDLGQMVDQPGIAIGMAWTQAGGKLLLVEASKAPGKGHLQITGQLGDVMKESVLTAYGWIKAHQELLSLLTLSPASRKTAIATELKSDLQLEKFDINIHFPAAAIPKDGPSAGITICIAMVILIIKTANLLDLFVYWY